MEEICYEVFGRLTSDHLKEASSEFEENLTDAVENARCLIRQCAPTVARQIGADIHR
jgi:hypothetical protein